MGVGVRAISSKRGREKEVGREGERESEVAVSLSEERERETMVSGERLFHVSTSSIPCYFFSFPSSS